tara:strand:+ start:470 stop:1027 length:558 start_codon:yes stop_codon:yes gene_type:complete
MIKFLGLLSKKNKIKPDVVASLYVQVLDNVINEGFVEIKEFINNNNNLETSPELRDDDIDWFRNVVFLGNIKTLDTCFEEKEVVILRGFILDEIYKDLDPHQQHLCIERFLDYENYFTDLTKEGDSFIQAMALALFEKYDINRHQGELFKRKNKPNPIFFNELRNLLKHFVWNWQEYLDKNKINF